MVYDVKVNSNLAKIIDVEQAELIYSIDEGNRYTIGKISTNLDEVFDKKLFTILSKTYKNLQVNITLRLKLKKF